MSKTKLRSKGFEKSFGNKIISEAYHKAKSDGSNPELVKAVEEAIGKNKESISEPTNKVKGVSSNSNEDNSASRDVESKKADIERRRQEELKLFAIGSRLIFYGSTNKEEARGEIIEDKEKAWRIKFDDGSTMNLSKEGEGITTYPMIYGKKYVVLESEDKINAKYDAELDALEKQQPPQGKGEGDWSAEQQRIENDKTLSAEQKEKAKIESTAKALGGVQKENADKFVNDFANIDIPFRQKNIQAEMDSEVKKQLFPNEKSRRKYAETIYSAVVRSNNFPKILSEAYHKAKLDGSNPELVKAVEDLLGKPKAVTPNVEDWSKDVESTAKALEGKDVSDIDKNMQTYIMSKKKLDISAST